MALLHRAGLGAVVALVLFAAVGSCRREEPALAPASDPAFEARWKRLGAREPFYIEADGGQGLMGRVRRVSEVRVAPEGESGKGGASATAELPEVLESEDINAIVRRQLASVKFCYQRLSKAGAAQPSGRAIVSFVIDKAGAVGGIGVDAPAFRDTDLVDCVTRQVERWSFPPSKQGGMVVSYPFVFVGG